MAIQSAINSMLGTVSGTITAVKALQEKAVKTKAAQAKAAAKQVKAQTASPATASPQAMAAQKAQQSMENAVEAKRTQRRNFMEYLKKQPSSLGQIGNLPTDVQKQIAKQYTPSQRQRLMDLADASKKKKEVNDGQHK